MSIPPPPLSFNLTSRSSSSTSPPSKTASIWSALQQHLPSCPIPTASKPKVPVRHEETVTETRHIWLLYTRTGPGRITSIRIISPYPEGTIVRNLSYSSDAITPQHFGGPFDKGGKIPTPTVFPRSPSTITVLRHSPPLLIGSTLRQLRPSSPLTTRPVFRPSTATPTPPSSTSRSNPTPR